MKEYLKLIGIKWYTIWLSWFLRILLAYITMSLLLAILGSIKLSTDFKDEFGKAISKALFLRTDFITIFVTFVVYSIQSAAFIVLVSQFFKKRKISKFFT